MDYALGAIFFLFGLSMGSFLGVCIDRLPANKSIVRPPSYCDDCGHKLGVLDLVPILSYLVLRGRCRYCGARIPYTVLLVELATAGLFLLFWYQFGLSRQFALALIYSCFFVVIFFIDIKHYLVLNKVIYLAIVIALIIAVATQYSDIKVPLLGGLIGGAIPFLIALIVPGGMGMGDVKLGVFIGIIVGYPQVFLFWVISVILGGFFGIGLLLTKKKGRKEAIPFAPFMVIGGIITMIYGMRWIHFFLGSVGYI